MKTPRGASPSALRAAFAAALAVALSPGCGAYQPTTTAGPRLQARAQVRAGNAGMAERLYQRAIDEGDPDARLEQAIWGSGGEPEWVGRIATIREPLERELGEVEGLLGVAHLLYGFGAVFLATGALLGIVGGIEASGASLGPCITSSSCGPGPDPNRGEGMAGAGIGLGVVGLGFLLTGLAFNVDSGARRGRWLDTVRRGGPRRLSFGLSASDDGAGLAVGGAF